MEAPVTIYLVDDHSIVRYGLKVLIERMGNYLVTRQFDHGQDLLDALDKDNLPDIIIMDLTMPVLDGRETMRKLKELGITTPVLMLTLETDEKVIVDLFRMGIRGYLPKSCTAELLKQAIDDVIHSGYYHDEMLSKALMADVKGKGKPTGYASLTEREKEFIEKVCHEQEYTYEQIADEMKVSRRTVDGYREAVFDKCDVKSKTGLVLYAIKHGLMRLPR